VLLRPYGTVTRSAPPRNGFRKSKMCMLPTMSLTLVEFLFPWKESASLVAALLKEDWCKADPPECSASPY
jgi:hypothetical protein